MNGKYRYKYLSGATWLPILGVVCEEAAVQSEGQAVLGEVTPHALTALGYHPRNPGGLQEVHLEIGLGV